MTRSPNAAAMRNGISSRQFERSCARLDLIRWALDTWTHLQPRPMSCPRGDRRRRGMESDPAGAGKLWGGETVPHALPQTTGDARDVMKGPTRDGVACDGCLADRNWVAFTGVRGIKRGGKVSRLPPDTQVRAPVNLVWQGSQNPRP